MKTQKKKNPFIVFVIFITISACLVAGEKRLTKEYLETQSAEKLKKLPDYRITLNQHMNTTILKNKNAVELSLYRNSIYAQYGREFKTKSIRNYFFSRAWYKPAKFSDSMLTPIDKINVRLVQIKETENVSYTDAMVIAAKTCNYFESRTDEKSQHKIEFFKDHTLKYTEVILFYGEEEVYEFDGTWRIAHGIIEVKKASQDSWRQLYFLISSRKCFQ
ncbi:MAG: YARHG domain-containing protein [Leptospirales bacterium]